MKKTDPFTIHGEREKKLTVRQSALPQDFVEAIAQSKIGLVLGALEEVANFRGARVLRCHVLLSITVTGSGLRLVHFCWLSSMASTTRHGVSDHMALV
jgi:hypothetical protein